MSPTLLTSAGVSLVTFAKGLTNQCEENSHMLIVNDDQRRRAGIKSLSKRCSYCHKPLLDYPLIISDDAVFGVYHAACAASLAIEIQVDLYTFFRPPAPYRKLFTLSEVVASDGEGESCAIKRS